MSDSQRGARFVLSFRKVKNEQTIKRESGYFEHELFCGLKKETNLMANPSD